VCPVFQKRRVPGRIVPNGHGLFSYRYIVADSDDYCALRDVTSRERAAVIV